MNFTVPPSPQLCQIRVHQRSFAVPFRSLSVTSAYSVVPPSDQQVAAELELTPLASLTYNPAAMIRGLTPPGSPSCDDTDDEAPQSTPDPLAARTLAFFFRTLMKTVRLHMDCAQPRSTCYQDTGDERHLFCLWHDGIIGHVFCLPAFHVSALVSQHGDGTYLADALDAIGVTPIRGSSRRGGAAALRQMLDAAADYHIAIATDGPMGPRREVKDGIIYLASQTGRAIIPAGFAARRAFRPRGRWTDLVIPLPFTRTYMCVGERIFVPPGLDREQLEPYRLQVQAAMDTLTTEADRRAGNDSTTRWAGHRPRAAADRIATTPRRRAA
jgi:lysophospholipid acyltransferase (LPLAT)-like uncharacterized protein